MRRLFVAIDDAASVANYDVSCITTSQSQHCRTKFSAAVSRLVFSTVFFIMLRTGIMETCVFECQLFLYRIISCIV